MRTILIADRERSIRKALELYFISRGDFVFMVKTAKEAEALLKTADLDVVIYDMQLPGDAALNIYNEAKDYCNAKFIFTSVYPELPEIDEIKTIADCRYLDKPFTIKDLKSIIPHPKKENTRMAV